MTKEVQDGVTGLVSVYWVQTERFLSPRGEILLRRRDGWEEGGRAQAMGQLTYWIVPPKDSLTHMLFLTC